MRIIRDVGEMQAFGQAHRGVRVGFVPTMGYLHRGHTSLMDLTRPRCDQLVVSIYVNPLQFAPTDDLARYPRDLDGDAKKCAAAGVDVLFIPEGFYPATFRTRVLVSDVTSRWEGAERPGHFEGVTTVVSRLFGVVQPTLACFGEKDYQQYTVLRSMTRDLALPIEIISGPLVRDTDGLALSSRNVYLTPEQRTRGTSLHRALFATRDATHVTDASGTRPATVAERTALGRARIEADRIDYYAIVDADSLEPLPEDEPVRVPARCLVTARYGSVRLLDNVAIEPA